jgi:MATE family multidrug resistance protein
MAIPIAISGLVSQAQILIDTAFLGHYSTTLPDGTLLSGKDFLAGSGNVFFPYIVTLAFIWSINTGTTILISQRIGAKEPGRALDFANAAIKYSSFLSIVIFFAWQAFAPLIFSGLGVKEPIRSISLDYLRTMSFELIPMGLATGLGAIFQGMGITHFRMKAGILQSVINAFLDWVLIFGKFGFPEMGAAGAGLATAISGYISTAYLILIIARYKKAPFKPSWSGVLKARFATYIPLMRVGIPTSLENVLYNASNLIIVGILNWISQDAVGILRLVRQVEITPVFFYIGIAMAVTTLVGNKTGERDIPGAKVIAQIGTVLSLILSVGFALIFILIPRPILSILTNDPALVEQSVMFLIIASVTALTKCVNIVSGNAIRGYGDTLWMLVTQIFGIVFVIGVMVLLVFQFKLGLYGVFIAFFLDETVRGIINTVRFYRGEKSVFHR